MNGNLVNDLFSEELTDFFDAQPSNTNIAPSKEPPVTESPKKKVDINSLIDTFGVNDKKISLKNEDDIRNIIKAIKVVKENISSIAGVYGDDVAEQLLALIQDEDLLIRRLRAIMERRLEKLARIRENENLLKAEEEEFNQMVSMDPSLLSIAIFLTVEKMIEKRLESKKNESTSGTSSMSTIITPEDKEKYLKSLDKKLALIEKHTGVKLDEALINFFKSDEYIYSTTLQLPDILRDEDYKRIMDAWSLPVLVNDTREEEASKEISTAEQSILALERYVAINGLGNSEDNPTIGLLRSLSSNVQEEKDRINADVDFFKKEKLKERVECAILYSVKDQTQNSKLQSLSSALKETITSRVNYMQDETVLRQERKEYTSDHSNKENERDSKDYLNALAGVNTAINQRREERAKGSVSFIPQSVTVMRVMRSQEQEQKLDEAKDMESINSQEELSFGGRQKVMQMNRNNFKLAS